jgi:hypothetical protein
MMFSSNNPFNERVLVPINNISRNRSNTIGSVSSDTTSLIDEYGIIESKVIPLTPKIIVPFPSLRRIDNIIDETGENHSIDENGENTNLTIDKICDNGKNIIDCHILNSQQDFIPIISNSPSPSSSGLSLSGLSSSNSGLSLANSGFSTMNSFQDSKFLNNDSKRFPSSSFDDKSCYLESANDFKSSFINSQPIDSESPGLINSPNLSHSQSCINSSKFDSFNIPKKFPAPSKVEYNNDSDDLSLLQNSRSSTPPTSCSSSTNLNSTSNCHSNQLEYLQLVEPMAIKPPRYSTLPPGGCPKYPILDTPVGNESLPSYSPLTYKICLASRKIEWLTPYEPSPQRSWKYVIVELNSTQLNLYSIPQNLEQSVLNFKPGQDLTQYEIDDLSYLNSQFTTSQDFQFLKFCQRLGCVDDTKKKLLRSYSLQHAKIGLASDYKKKPYVLRLRVESEQILLSFNKINDLVAMNLGLTIGRDLSLDLNERECPRYRTVPRRRRNRRAHSDPYVSTFMPASTRAKSNSLPSSKLSCTISKLKLKFKHEKPIPNENLNTESRTPQALPVVISQDDHDHEHIDDYQEDVELSDLREEEDDDEDEIEDDAEDGILSPVEGSSHSIALPTFHAPTAEYSKWNPDIETQSESKYYKNCLRCIKPLTPDDAWVSKSIVKPTPLSPLNLAYLLKLSYESSSNSTHSSLSQGSKSNILVGSKRARSRSGSSKDGNGLSLADSMLTKIPDHFLKEYKVGAHGLIPQQLQVS